MKSDAPLSIIKSQEKRVRLSPFVSRKIQTARGSWPPADASGQTIAADFSAV
jgi:hypothetical protein